MTYINRVKKDFLIKYEHEPEYVQAVNSFLDSVVEANVDFDLLEKNAILERLIEPERMISFKVTWTDDNHQVRVNKAYRIQHSSLLGPFKGGLRFHPSVNYSTMKFLAFEQTLKKFIDWFITWWCKGWV